MVLSALVFSSIKWGQRALPSLALHDLHDHFYKSGELSVSSSGDNAK